MRSGWRAQSHAKACWPRRCSPRAWQIEQSACSTFWTSPHQLPKCRRLIQYALIPLWALGSGSCFTPNSFLSLALPWGSPARRPSSTVLQAPLKLNPARDASERAAAAAAAAAAAHEMSQTMLSL